MKTIIVLSLFAVALAAPQNHEIPIVRQNGDINPDGSFQYSFETGNGIITDANGQLKSIGAEEPALEIQGQVKYQGDDGIPIELRYIADQNGFQPQGVHLPTPPPLPEDIQRALAYLATAPPQTE